MITSSQEQSQMLSETIRQLQAELEQVHASYQSDINQLRSCVEQLHNHITELQQALAQKRTIRLPALKWNVNWYKLFRSLHLCLGLGTSGLMAGICILGFIVRHPRLFGVDKRVSSLNSGVFLFDDRQVDLSPLLDVAAFSLLALTASGIGIWYIPKRLKKRKSQEAIPAQKPAA